MNKLKKVNGNFIEVEDEDHPNVETSAIDFYDEIDALTEVKPKDRRSKEYKNWKKNINRRIEEANGALGRKIFNLIK